jgi:hypothetical protein
MTEQLTDKKLDQISTSTPDATTLLKSLSQRIREEAERCVSTCSADCNHGCAFNRLPSQEKSLNGQEDLVFSLLKFVPEKPNQS